MNRFGSGAGRALVALGVGAALSLTCAACGGEDEGAASGGEASKSVRIAITTSADIGDVVPVGGLVRLGSEFGLDVKKSDIQRFESHATGAQVLLSGRADVLGGSFGGDLTLIEKGRDLKIFCPAQSSTAEMVVGIGDVTSIDALKDPKVALAVDSPGGGADFQLNALLIVTEAGFLVRDVPNKIILEDGGQRVNALQRGEADVSVVDPSELLILQQALGKDKVNVISTMAEDVGDKVVDMTFAASSEWLTDNADLAAQFCATVITAADRLTEDFETYEELANEYIEPDPGVTGLRALFDLGQRFPVWPSDPLITEEQFEANVDIAVAAGSIESPEALVYEDVIAVDVMRKAADIVAGKS